jgi:hypothetical protein
VLSYHLKCLLIRVRIVLLRFTFSENGTFLGLFLCCRSYIFLFQQKATNDIVCDPKFTLVHSMLTKEQIKMVQTCK